MTKRSDRVSGAGSPRSAPSPSRPVTAGWSPRPA